MDKDINNSDINNSPSVKDSEGDKSFVGKFKSHVSDIINSTPLSKWFRKQDSINSTVRRRDDEYDDEELFQMQPPSKRAKLPSDNNVNNFNKLHFNDTSIITPLRNNVTDTQQNKFTNFPEPVAGPSGLKSRKMLSSATTLSANSVRNSFSTHSELLNGHKDSDSEESTSGYSSVAKIGSKEQVCESAISSKQTSPLQNSPTNSRSLFHSTSTGTNRSLFTERSYSPQINSSLSSRRPSFNASTFGSPNFVDKTLSTKRIINSPFYSGRTIYGGASAYGRQLGRTSKDLRSSLRNSVQIKPVHKNNENTTVALGKTARRILDTLEQYSTPVNDAKKIPLPNKRSKQDGLLSKYTCANPYTIRDSKHASNRELQVPSVPDLLKMKQRERLQESTVTVRQIATSSKSSLNTESYKIIDSEDTKQKHTGKMKTKVTSVRQKPDTDETVKEVNLPTVSLPISTLPKFDLVIPPPNPIKSTSPTKIEKKNTIQFHQTPITHKTQPAQLVQEKVNVETENKPVQKDNQNIEYKFSKPIVLAENIESLVPVNSFKFSEPIILKRTDTDSVLNFKMPETKNVNILSNIKIKNNGDAVKPAPQLLMTGSVTDILGKKDNSTLLDKFKPAEGTWECSACMIRNKPEVNKCIACETPKTKTSLQPTSGLNIFGKKDSLMDKFKPAEGTWECSACMIRNKPEVNKCVSCETPKTSNAPTQVNKSFGSQFKLSSDKWECSACMVRNNNADSKCVACTTPKPSTIPPTLTPKSTGFGDKFKPLDSTWECGTCMIRNNNNLTKCAACETSKPGSFSTTSSFGNEFKPPSSTWECTTCMIRNKDDLNKCAACETLRPGKKSTSSFGSAFNIKDDEWECSVCMVRNKSQNNKCQCCETVKPGSTQSSLVLPNQSDKKPIPTFNFGIDKSEAVSFKFGIPPNKIEAPNSTTTPASSIFGEAAKPSAAAAAPATFSFGIPSDKPKSEESLKVPEVVKPSDTTPALKPAEKSTEQKEPAPTLFKFGTAATSQSNEFTSKAVSSTAVSSTTDTTKPMFNFKPVAANGDLNKSSGLTPGSTSIPSFSGATSTTNSFIFQAKPTATASPLSQSSVQKEPSQIPASDSTFKFGSNSQTPTKPLFGSANINSNTPKNNGFAPINGGDNKPFKFGSSDSGEPAMKTPAFSFSKSDATPPVTKSSGFNFGSSAPSNTFNFSGAKADPPIFNSSSTNIFGSPSNSTSKNGTFNFGSMAPNNNTQKAVFSFGAATPGQTPQTSNQPTFNFGSAAAAAPTPSTGGFNFSGGPPTFDANVKPSFNFTDGKTVTTFSAQPSAEGGMPTQRKMKRAVRRTPR